MVLAVLFSSAIGTTTVYADDGSGTGETSEPAPSGDEVTPVETTGDEVTSAVGESAAPVEDQPAVEESVSVPEILEQVPENIEVVVVNETGEVEPLATEAAAEIIAASDPIWCKEGKDPSSSTAGDCTSGWATVSELITNLNAVSGTFVGNGTIFFSNTAAYTVDDVTFDGTVLTDLDSLTLQGGWNGSGNALWGLSGTYSLSGSTTFNTPITIQNWVGNIFIKDIEVVSGIGTVGYGLGVTTTGNIELDNVYVHNTTGSGDGAKLSNIGGGDVTITDSKFNNNLGGNGLLVESGGAITLNTVEASDNGLTGASLENCLYTGSQCLGSDLVTVTSATANQFNRNGFDGLVIDSGGGIALDHLTANENGVSGASLMSTDTGGVGNINVSQSEFNLNANGTGLDVFADGTINVDNVVASDNRSGTTLDTTKGVGAVTVDISEFSSNTSTGLHVESGSTIDLTNVVASDNGTNGAYLEAAGNINVEDSTFNDNVHFNFPADPGLYANSNGGNITLTNVIADGNDYGAGAVLSTKNNGTVNVTGGHFNGNGTFGVQAQTQDGDITLDGITASLNQVKGAYLNAHGLGNIFIKTSTFVENGAYGIYAAASDGDINLDHVTVTGNNVTDYGAVLSTWNGGTVLVSDSAFKLNTKTGLEIIASGQVNLVNVTADQNGGNGIEIYSTYTNSCRCADSKVVNVPVNVDGGTFTNNGSYGLMVKPGPTGTLTFTNPSTFGGNGLGDYLLDLSDPAECAKCGCDDPGPADDAKEPKVVEVPFTGGAPVRLDYEDFSSTILRLPNGNSAEFIYPSFNGFGKLEGLLEENLPGRLGAGIDFIGGMNVSLTDEDGNLVTVNPDGTITVEFKLPENGHGRYSILYWDPTLNNGAGGWVQLPLFEEGTSFPLNPDDPEDGRTILSGVQQVGNTMTITVNFPGIFVLVAR
jgi:hypothetical protein